MPSRYNPRQQRSRGRGGPRGPAKQKPLGPTYLPGSLSENLANKRVEDMERRKKKRNKQGRGGYRLPK